MGEIRIVVETLTGGAFHLEIESSERVLTVKETLCHIQGLPPSLLCFPLIDALQAFPSPISS
jgi:hypothetical protein